MAATIIAFAYAQMAAYQQRTGLPIDPASQIQCIVRDPVHFAHVIFGDIVLHGRHYVESAIGRLGLSELPLPWAIVVVEILTLVAAAATSGLILTPRARVAMIAIFISTVVGIQLSQYLVWNIVCGDVIEGVQGRYFLPVVPVALMAISLSRSRWRLDMRVLAAVAFLCNAFALAAMVRRYWI